MMPAPTITTSTLFVIALPPFARVSDTPSAGSANHRSFSPRPRATWPRRRRGLLADDTWLPRRRRLPQLTGASRAFHARLSLGFHYLTSLGKRLFTHAWLRGLQGMRHLEEGALVLADISGFTE